MDNHELIEKKNISEAAQGVDISRRTETVRLVEMGQVSVETKGFYRGLEIGFTPRS
jgi:hypothetical protein